MVQVIIYIYLHTVQSQLGTDGAEPLSHRSAGVVSAAPIYLPVKSSFLSTCRTSHTLEKDMHVLIGAYYLWPLATVWILGERINLKREHFFMSWIWDSTKLTKILKNKKLVIFITKSNMDPNCYWPIFPPIIRKMQLYKWVHQKCSAEKPGKTLDLWIYNHIMIGYSIKHDFVFSAVLFFFHQAKCNLLSDQMKHKLLEIIHFSLKNWLNYLKHDLIFVR